jgi:hypothetical protein
MPLSPEFQSALDFLSGFRWFPECPEFEFDGCWWRFTPYVGDERDPFNRNTEHAHHSFDSLAKNFSPGLESLLTSHVKLDPHVIVPSLCDNSRRCSVKVRAPRSARSAGS